MHSTLNAFVFSYFYYYICVRHTRAQYYVLEMNRFSEIIQQPDNIVYRHYTIIYVWETRTTYPRAAAATAQRRGPDERVNHTNTGRFKTLFFFPIFQKYVTRGATSQNRFCSFFKSRKKHSDRESVKKIFFFFPPVNRELKITNEFFFIKPIEERVLKYRLSPVSQNSQTNRGKKYPLKIKSHV